MSLPIRAVKAVIQNEYGQILLLQRNPKLHSVDNWDLPGGLVEDDENEEQALIREIKEELNIDATIKEKSGVWTFLRQKDQQWVSVQNYICEMSGGSIILSDEHVDYRWILPAEIIGYAVKDISLYSTIQKM